LKLFIDDIRRCPDGWIPARTITEAIRILDTQDVEEVSLDHDICCQSQTGEIHSSWETFEPVARFIFAKEELRSNPAFKIRIHTANPAGGQRMADIMGIQYDNKIFNEEDYRA